MIGLGIYSFVIGLLNVWSGACGDATTPRWALEIDDTLVRLLGVAFMLLGLASMRKCRWSLTPLAVVYSISLVEFIVTKAPVPIILTAIALFGLPLLFIINQRFRWNSTRPHGLTNL